MVKVFYEDILIGEVLTNKNLTVDEALNLIEFDERQFIINNNFDDINYSNFKLEY